jgi:hypothetical protein
VKGTEISDTPAGAFTVMNVTDTSNLPYQNGGGYYGYDEKTGYNATGFNYGYGYGYGYGSTDLIIVYTITYKTCTPGTFYAKLSVNSTTYTYTSGKSTSFTVKPKLPPLISIFVDIKPGFWPNLINHRDHGFLLVAICGTKTFDVHMIDPRTIRLSLAGGKKGVEAVSWSYQDVATPGLGSVCGHKSRGDGYLDLVLKFRNLQVFSILKLFRHPGETLRLTITGALKNTYESIPVEGHDSVQVLRMHE